MSRYSNMIPDGARDLLFKECESRRSVEQKLVSIFKLRGFSEVATPSLEFYDVFSGKSPVMDDEIIYKLIDGRGRILVLRPDNTTPIARIASTRLKGFLPPLRLYYNQSVFRVSPSMSGRYDEVAQCGVELIGVNGKKADIDIILTAVSALKGTAADDFRFEIGHVGFFKAIIEELPVNDEEKEKIRNEIALKNYASLTDGLKPYSDGNAACLALKELPRLFGGREVLDRAFKIAPNARSRETIEYLQSIYDCLCEMGLEKNIMIDLGMVQQIDYYTGVVFRGYMHGPGEAMLSGGRYDGLFSRFGADMPATGFAVDVDAIAKLKSRNESYRPDALIHYETGYEKDAFQHLEKLVNSGLTCEMSVFSGIGEAMDYARKKGISRLELVGREIRSTKVLEDGNETAENRAD